MILIPANGDRATTAAWKFKSLDLERAGVGRMRAPTWNLNNRRQACLDQADFVIHREPDIVVLTEVHPSRIDRREALKGYDVEKTTSISERPRAVLLAAKGGKLCSRTPIRGQVIRAEVDGLTLVAAHVPRT